MMIDKICMIALILWIPVTSNSQDGGAGKSIDILYSEFWTQPKEFAIRKTINWVEFKIIYDTTEPDIKEIRSTDHIGVHRDNPSYLEIIVNDDTTHTIYSPQGIVFQGSEGEGMPDALEDNYHWIKKVRFLIELQSSTNCIVYCKIKKDIDKRKITSKFDCNAEWGKIQYVHYTDTLDRGEIGRNVISSSKDFLKIKLHNEFDYPALSLLSINWNLYKFKDLEGLSASLMDSLDGTNTLPAQIIAEMKKVRAHTFPLKLAYPIAGSSYGIAMLMKANSEDYAFKNFISGFTIMALFFSPLIIRSFEYSYIVFVKDRSFNQPYIKDQWDINFSFFPFMFLLADFIEGDGLNGFGAIRKKIGDPPDLPDKPFIMPLQIRFRF